MDIAPRGNESETDLRSIRSVAQLNMLHSLAAKLNSLADIEEIANAITAELRTIIDYHNCRVYILQEDGRTLLPLAFRGDLFSEYERESYDELVTVVGEGITGHVAQTRRSLLTPDANEISFSVVIPGTDPDILESMLAVPMLAGDETVGVIVLSKLGYGQFDEEDQRMLEVLASHAAVAVENAKLLLAERGAAETSATLLHLSQALTGVHTEDAILEEAIETIRSMIACSAIVAYVRDKESGAFRQVRAMSLDARIPDVPAVDVDPDVASRFLTSLTEPFVMTKEVIDQVPSEYRLVADVHEALVAPIRWETEGFGTLVLVALDGRPGFGDRELRLARGVADITSLALGNATRISELERFHELVESLDAVFWEADAGALTFEFLSRRASEVLGGEPSTWLELGRAWGDHILPEDREESIAAFRSAVEGGENQSVEYRVTSPAGRTAWIRDLLHVVRGPQGVEGVRGLMVDITERKRAEQALRRSERKYSEAFKREREAAQRLRALDDMKNTFLEAVSHDLRTPLTSILGSALTLEQSELALPPEDARDLVRGIASNARKLERLLTDLLDLDRLQRGILSPQRRPTDVEALVRRAVEESRALTDRPVEVDVPQLVVSIDGAKVERILENLLSNAIRHTPPECRIWVRAQGEDDGLLLIVEDEGPSIPVEMRDAIFEPFRQVPGSAAEHSPGVGVGLSLVRRFAELHGGRAWIQDREGGGASFRVLLPKD